MARSPDLATGPQPDSYSAHVATPGLTRNTTRLPPAGATRPNGEPNGTASLLPLQMEDLAFLWVGLNFSLWLGWARPGRAGHISFLAWVGLTRVRNSFT